jgi:hypothetical protein
MKISPHSPKFLFSLIKFWETFLEIFFKAKKFSTFKIKEKFGGEKRNYIEKKL